MVVAVLVALSISASVLIGAAIWSHPDTSRGCDVTEVAARVFPSLVTINVRAGAGSGTGPVLDEQGNILTNDHVIEAAAGGGITSTSSVGARTCRRPSPAGAHVWY